MDIVKLLFAVEASCWIIAIGGALFEYVDSTGSAARRTCARRVFLALCLGWAWPLACVYWLALGAKRLTIDALSDPAAGQLSIPEKPKLRFDPLDGKPPPITPLPRDRNSHA